MSLMIASSLPHRPYYPGSMVAGTHMHSNKLVPLFVLEEGGCCWGVIISISLLSLPYLSLPPPPPPLSMADGELGWFGAALSRTAESGKLKATAYLGTAHHHDDIINRAIKL